MARILITSRLPDDALDPIVGHELMMPELGKHLTTDEIAHSVRDVDAIVCHLKDRIDAAVFALASRLAVVATVSVGYDNVDIDAATRSGVAVCHTPGVLDDTTADLAFALILAASRLLSDSERDLRTGGWTDWQFDAYLGRDVYGATLGLVGYGRIARAVARRAEGFSMRVLHHARRPTGLQGCVIAWRTTSAQHGHKRSVLKGSWAGTASSTSTTPWARRSRTPSCQAESTTTSSWCCPSASSLWAS
jgi:glyoxylate reductase